MSQAETTPQPLAPPEPVAAPPTPTPPPPPPAAVQATPEPAPAPATTTNTHEPSPAPAETTAAPPVLTPALHTPATGAHPMVEIPHAGSQEQPPGAGSPGFGSPMGRKDIEKLRREEKRKKREHEIEQERERIMTKKLPLKFTIDTLSTNLEGKELMRDLGLYIPFLVSFMFFFFAGRDLEQSYFSVASIKDTLVFKDQTAGNFNETTKKLEPNIHGQGPFWRKNWAQTAISADWYDYMELLLIPQLWPIDQPDLVRDVPRTTAQNIALGTLRVRMFKVRPDSCEVNKYFYPDDTKTQNRTCYGRFSTKHADTAPFGDPNIMMFNYTDGCSRSGQGIAGEIDRYPCGGYITEMPFSASYMTAIRWARNLRATGFVDDNAVRFIVMEFFTYNPGLDTFTANRLFVEITAGGGWLPTQRFRTFSVFTKSNGRIVYEFYFLGFVLYYWIKFFVEMYRSRRGLWFVFGLWPFVEIVNLSAFIIVFIARWLWWSTSTEETWTLPYTGGFPDSLDYIQNTYQLQVYFNSLNCVLSFLKLLKFVRLNDRLNILTRTLSACAQNILGVLILFVLVIFAYAITGAMLFGGGLSDYRNIGTSFSTCMRIVIGNFDYDSMKQENRSVAFIFFWTFVVLANFVLLNFIIAVITEGFEQESEKSKAVPFDHVLSRFMSSVRSIFTSQFCSEFYHAVIARTRRLPEVTILDYLITWRQALLSEQGIQEELVQMEVIAEPDLEFGRQDFHKAIPQTEQQFITEELLDELWEDFVMEYEMERKDEVDEDKENRLHMYRRAIMKATTDVLLGRTDSTIEKSIDFVGGTASQSTNAEVATLFTKPRPGLQGLEDRTSNLKQQADDMLELMCILLNKANALELKK
eukprot:PhF_6_TR612/c1_g1_i1/m.793